MDELVIGEKKYISSKRAAEITGYAKDYIGQLCREGRVEARLVGRSWYVLDTSITEHRFGKTEDTKEITVAEVTAAPEQPIPSWDAPRYAAEEVSPLPVLKRPMRSTLNLLDRDHMRQVTDISNVEAVIEKKEATEIIKEIEEGETPVPMRRVETQVSARRVISLRPSSQATEVQMPPPQRVPKPKMRRRKANLAISATVVAISILAICIILIGTGTVETNYVFLDFLGGKSFYNR